MSAAGSGWLSSPRFLALPQQVQLVRSSFGGIVADSEKVPKPILEQIDQAGSSAVPTPASAPHSIANDGCVHLPGNDDRVSRIIFCIVPILTPMGRRRGTNHFSSASRMRSGWNIGSRRMCGESCIRIKTRMELNRWSSLN